jgi:hypothetical protein
MMWLRDRILLSVKGEVLKSMRRRTLRGQDGKRWKSSIMIFNRLVR